MPSSGLLISWAMPAARRPTVVSRSAWKSCRSSSRTRALLGRAGLEPRATAGLLHGEGAEQQREAHHREVEGVGRAVAGPHRLGEAHDRPLRLRAGEGERARGRPALRAHRRLRAHFGFPRGQRRRAGPPGSGRAGRPSRRSSRHCRGESAPGSPGSRSEAGSTSVSIVTPPASGRAASPCGSRAVSRGRVGSIAAPSCPVGVAETQSTGTPPRRPTCTSGRPSDARTPMRTTSAWLRRKRRRALSAAWRSSEAADGVLPGLVEPGDRGRGAEEGEVGAHLGEPPLERRRLGRRCRARTRAAPRRGRPGGRRGCPTGPPG